MQYMCYDLKQLDGGQILEVELSAVANIKLMNAENYASYQVGRLNRYVGGRVTRSPYRVLVPHPDHWFCIVEGGGRHAVRVLPASMAAPRHTAPPAPTVPAAPPAMPRQPGRQAPSQPPNAPPIVSTPPPVVSTPPPVAMNSRLRATGAPPPSHATVGAGSAPPPPPPASSEVRDKRYDVFVCHAPEDQESVAKELAKILGERGIRAGYDGFELYGGDNLRDLIDKGLKNSKIGVVVISRSLVKKGWSGRALDKVLSLYQRSLIPVWHHITAEEVFDYNASVARRAAKVATKQTIYDVADDIQERLRM